MQIALGHGAAAHITSNKHGPAQRAAFEDAVSHHARIESHVTSDAQTGTCPGEITARQDSPCQRQFLQQTMVQFATGPVRLGQISALQIDSLAVAIACNAAGAFRCLQRRFMQIARLECGADEVCASEIHAIHTGRLEHRAHKTARRRLDVLPISTAAGDAIKTAAFIEDALSHYSIVHDCVGKWHVLKG